MLRRLLVRVAKIVRDFPILCAVAIAVSLPTGSWSRAEEQPAPEQVEFFEKKVRPILVEHCYSCHSAKADDLKGGLRLDTRKGVRAGGDSGPAVVPGDPDASLLIQAVRYEEDAFQMPPSGKLSEEVIESLVEWVRMGAPDPRGDEAPEPGGAEAKRAAGEQHWSFQPPHIPPRPHVQHADWPTTEFDVYLLARLEAAGLEPSPEADRRQLARRLYIDLLGIPPRYGEIEAFACDTSADAYERLVDRLLASPHFGERWGRHWLDVARYADTKGYVFQEDRSYPDAYTYRDWVVQTLNADLPYDQFVQYQIAGDQLPELPGLSVPTQAAMGFLTLGRRFLNNKHDIIDDRIDVMMRGTLGLTVTCARCHDHKYDPITMADYYGLYGVLDSSLEPKDGPSPLRLVDSDTPRDARVLLRGQPGNPGPVAPRRFVRLLSRPDEPAFQHGSGRLELAQAITRADNPLTARVMVNRVWLHLFGEGLTTTPSDFGVRSDPPAQPEVLDVLAVRFMENGWSLKQLIRAIVLSSAYRQTSRVTEDARRKDPENRLFGRQNRRRVDLETLRDGILAVSGELDLRMGGPSVDITKPPFPRRRSAYAFVDRQNLPGLFRVFDFASPDTHNPKRLETTTPQQSLFLMNHPFVLAQSERLADRIAVDTGSSDTAFVRELYRRVLGRDPTDRELHSATAFLQDADDMNVSSADRSAWAYGYGRRTEPGEPVEFHSLPHFTGQAWQGSDKLPDAQLGWASLTAKGGHPGDARHAVIRRWTAPMSGTVLVRGLLVHPSDQGDGVRARAITRTGEVIGEWVAEHGHVATACDNVSIAAGETLDFVVDCRENVSFDSFQWTIRVAYGGADGPRPEFRSEDHFHGPDAAPFSPRRQLAQILLLTNEFQFVD